MSVAEDLLAGGEKAIFGTRLGVRLTRRRQGRVRPAYTCLQCFLDLCSIAFPDLKVP